MMMCELNEAPRRSQDRTPLKDVAKTLDELSSQLAVAERLLAGSIEQDCAASAALEMMLSVSADLQISISQLKTHLATFRTTTTIAAIQHQVALHFGIPLIEMVSNRQARVVARPRQVAMYLAKEMTGQSFAAIGAKFGNRDHTTVMHAVKQVKNLMSISSDFGRSVTDIRLELARK